MSDVKIRIHRGDDQHLATTVTIPGGILKIAPAAGEICV